MSFTPLPKYLLLVMVEYLPYEDFVTVSTMNTALGRYLQLRIKVIKKPGFELAGPYECPSEP